MVNLAKVDFAEVECEINLRKAASYQTTNGALDLRQMIQNLFERQREIGMRILEMYDRRAQTIAKRFVRGRTWLFQRRLNIVLQMLKQLPRFVVKRLRLVQLGVKLLEGLVELLGVHNAFL